MTSSNEKVKVLVVDDQDGVRYLLYEILRSEGYSVFTAANGNEAIGKVEKTKPDIVVLDMKMPGKSGLEVLKELNKRNFCGRYILMTAYGELDITNEAERLGVRYKINKPFDICDFREVINQVYSEIARSDTFENK